MVPMPPAAPVKTMRREASLASAMFLSLCQPSIALERARQVLAHGTPRLGGILVGDAGHDARMLMLNAFEINPPLGWRVNRKPHALARDDVTAEEGQEARELPIAGSFGNGAMKSEILGARALAAMQGEVEGAPGAADHGDLSPWRAFGGKGGCLDLDRQAQLHHFEDVGQGRRLGGGDTKRSRRGIGNVGA